MRRALMTVSCAWMLSAAAHGAQPCRPGKLSAVTELDLATVGRGFNDPVHIANAGDGSGRLFIVEQSGVIRTLEEGRPSPSPFLDIRDRVDSGGEKGLLSVAFHPDFSANGRVFVNYTSRRRRKGKGRILHTVISEFAASKDRSAADKSSEVILLSIDQPYGNHNGGQIAFGPDGHLYIGTGDGGSARDPQGNAQNRVSLLGKMLRIDVNGTRFPYAIPGDNPFVTGGGRPEIFAYGLRNPWRFAFDPLSGTLFAGDVGQNNWEEIDVIIKGGNYGWRLMEASHCTPKVESACVQDKRGVSWDCTGRPSATCPPRSLHGPLHEYKTRWGSSVIAGNVYRGKAIPLLCGVYLFGDYGSGEIWGLRTDLKNLKVKESRLLLDTDLDITSFGLDEALELYVADHDGKIFRIASKESLP